jgi:hypothetical protein
MGEAEENVAAFFNREDAKVHKEQYKRKRLRTSDVQSLCYMLKNAGESFSYLLLFFLLRVFASSRFKSHAYYSYKKSTPRHS